MYVRCYHHAVDSGMYLCLIVILLVVSIMFEHLVAFFLVLVLDVPYQTRSVVAFQYEYHLQIVTEVVL